MPTTVLISDDHRILREGLRTLLENQPGIAVVGEADNGRTTVGLAKELRPDVVIMDVAMPGLNGIEATRQIIAEAPGVKVLGLSMHSDRRFVGQMLRAGASGYLLKDSAFEELTVAIQAVARNQTFLGPGVTGVIVSDYVHHFSATKTAGALVLTPREREVLQLLAEGKTSREIAGLFHVSVKTVETHRKNLMDKLDLHSVAELTKYAVREGLTSLES